jgi:protocatechuate 4,5-dioxygenase beta chain
MAQIVGCVNTSHVPSIARALAQGLQQDPYWEPFFKGFHPIHRWLEEEAKPDVAVVFYNDHGLNFFLDKMPTFAIGAGQEYINGDEGWGMPDTPPFAGEEPLSRQLVNNLVDHDFDLTICQDMQVDHAFALPLKLLFPGGPCPVTVVPISINTVLYPFPSARRCAALGKQVGDAIRAWDSDKRVLIVGTGGLSHQLEGERAGHLNPEFDKQFLDSLTQEDPNWLTQFSSEDIIEQVGTAGLEIIMWIAARNTLQGPVREISRNYHIPISNTAAGTQAFAPL